MKDQKTSAFTLIELLVVVAIMTLLLALVLQALQHSREMGKATDCANNLRQIHVAIYSNAQDNGGYFPFLYYWWKTLGTAGYLGKGEMHGGITTPGPSGWAYRETRWPVFRCRAEKGEFFNTTDTNCKQPNPKTTGYDSDLVHTSYAMNWGINEYDGYYASYCGLPNCPARPRRFFQDPVVPHSKTPLVTDHGTPLWGWHTAFFQSNIDNPDQYYVHGYEGANYYIFRHPGRKANMLYLDGHVEGVQHKNQTGVSLYFSLYRTGVN